MSRTRETGSIYLGIAGGLFVVSGALVGAYFVLGGDASAAATPPAGRASTSDAAPAADPTDLRSLVEGSLAETVEVVIADRTVPLRWSDLGVVVDDAELGRAARLSASDEPIASLRAAGALPLKVDRDKAIAALTALKGQHDRAAL